MSRLRLAAACALLKLAQEPCYHEIITLEQFQLCALVINVRTSTKVSSLHEKLMLVLGLCILFFVFMVLILYRFEIMNYHW